MKSIIIGLVLVGLAVLSGCQQVVFVSERDGHAQLYKMTSVGFGQTNISNNTFQDHFPDLSPDATQIVFSSFRDGPGENIYVMNIDGTGGTALTSGSGQRIMPRWGSNNRIAFQYPAYRIDTQIWSVNNDGTGLQQITFPGTNEADNGGHDFYDAGAMLVFSRYDRTTQRRVLYSVNSSGSGTPVRLTDIQDVSETLPVVSHDGRLFAYREFNHASHTDRIRVLTVPDWTLVNEINIQPPADRNISGIDFAAGDQRLFFSVQSSDITDNPINIRHEVFSINLDGSDQRRLTENRSGDTWPASVTALVQEPPVARIPVLFVHGHSGNAVAAWQQSGSSGTTSFAAALAANPSLPIDPYYLELPVHGDSHPESQARSIADDAVDILAAIEGGLDSAGVAQTGILNMPAYQAIGRVALVGYSQGAISSRYYLKNLMGNRSNAQVTVSEFVALAAPNHGVGGIISCSNANQPDRSTRELCAGRTASLASQAAPCGSCLGNGPGPFNSNVFGDQTFLTQLNGHGDFTASGDGFIENCANGTVADPAQEAPHSRPTQSDGVLYINLYAANNADNVVGGGTQAFDCLGRRLSRSHAPDVTNMEITGVPTIVHANFPHYWPTICVALHAITDHASPANQTAACSALNPPS
ncbi:MAG: hypothetical protein ACU85E_14030 [Gammaproteobacteria bacterium]